MRRFAGGPYPSSTANERVGLRFQRGSAFVVAAYAFLTICETAAAEAVKDCGLKNQPTASNETDAHRTKGTFDPQETKTIKDGDSVYAGFRVSADENAVVVALKRFRESEKLPPLTPDKRLFDAARANAQTDAQGKPSARVNVQGYTGTFRLAIPARKDALPSSWWSRFSSKRFSAISWLTAS